LRLIAYKISILCSSLLFNLFTWASNVPLQLSERNDDNTNLISHLKYLSSDQLAGRKFSSQYSQLTQEYLVTTLEKLAVPAFDNKYRHTFTRKSVFQIQQGTNVIAYVPGTHHAKEYIILSAHYDHLGAKQGKIFNGADDNASGTAALLLYAKLLKQQPLKYSVILLFTDGEEINLLGAKAFIDQQGSLLNEFKLNINLDMIAGSKNTKRLRFISRDLEKILSTESLDDFNQLQLKLKKDSTVRLTSGFRGGRRIGIEKKRTNWRMASDHGIFSKAGVPFVYFGVGEHKNYHTVHDDFEHVNQQFFLAATAVIFEQIIYLDNAISNNATRQKGNTVAKTYP
jgi:Zn-dependent M28 family amino/carboxypeptidase